MSLEEASFVRYGGGSGKARSQTSDLLEGAGCRLLLLRDGHLRGRCALVDVRLEGQLLVWLHGLLHLGCPQCIEFGLRLLLLLSADVVQEVDIVLTQLLSGLSQGGLLHTEVANLGAQRTEALSDVLADTKLLRSQVADALSQLLLQLGLLTQNVGLLTSHACVLTSKTCLLTSQLTVQTRCALAELTLLTSSLHLTLACGLSQASTLEAQSTQLLACAQRTNACLTQCIGSLQPQLSTLDAVLSLHLLVCQGSLHGLLSIHALSLQRRSLILHRSLLLCVEVLGTHGEACLLVGLLGREPRLLLLVELALGLLVGALESRGLDIAQLRTQVTLTFGLDNRLTAATKSACTGGSGLLPSALDVGLADGLALLRVDHVLHVRRHVGFCRTGLGKALGRHLLGRSHLSGLHLSASNLLSSDHRCVAQLSSLSCLSGSIVESADALVGQVLSLAHGPRTLQCTAHHRFSALLEPGLHGRLTSHLLGHIKVLTCRAKVAKASACYVGQIAQGCSGLSSEVVGLLCSSELTASVSTAQDIGCLAQRVGTRGQCA